MTAKEEILKLAADSYRQGGIDLIESMKEAINEMIKMGVDTKLTLAEVIDLVDTIKDKHLAN